MCFSLLIYKLIHLVYLVLPTTASKILFVDRKLKCVLSFEGLFFDFVQVGGRPT